MLKKAGYSLRLISGSYKESLSTQLSVSNDIKPRFHLNFQMLLNHDGCTSIIVRLPIIYLKDHLFKGLSIFISFIWAAK